MRPPIIPLALCRHDRNVLRDHAAAIAAAVQIDESTLLATGLPARCFCNRITLKLAGGETTSFPRALVVHDGDSRLVLTRSSGYFVFEAHTVAALDVEATTNAAESVDAETPRRKAMKRRKPRGELEVMGVIVPFARPPKRD